MLSKEQQAWENLRKAILADGGLITRTMVATMPTRTKPSVIRGESEGIHPVRPSYGFDVV